MVVIVVVVVVVVVIIVVVVVVETLSCHLPISCSYVVAAVPGIERR